MQTPLKFGAEGHTLYVHKVEGDEQAANLANAYKVPNLQERVHASNNGLRGSDTPVNAADSANTVDANKYSASTNAAIASTTFNNATNVSNSDAKVATSTGTATQASEQNFEKEGFTFSLTIPDGQKIAIIGESGAGKTTLLNVIAGFLPIASGELYVNEQLANDLEPSKRGCVYVFQDNNHFPNLTMQQNVELGFSFQNNFFGSRVKLFFARIFSKVLYKLLQIVPNSLQTSSLRKACFRVQEYIKKLYRTKRWQLTPAQKLRAVEDMLEILGISKIANKYPAECSGGQLQRAGLARAFLYPHDYWLLLDEPLSALDAKNRHLIVELLKARPEQGMLIVTHNLEDLEGLVDRVIRVSNGKIVEDYLINKH